MINVSLFCLVASPKLSNLDNEEETKLLHSEIWTTLFRGGYITGKLQRSLSGYHVSEHSLSLLKSYKNSVLLLNPKMHLIFNGNQNLMLSIGQMSISQGTQTIDRCPGVERVNQ